VTDAIKSLSVTIKEHGGSEWVITWPDGESFAVDSAAEALQLVQNFGRRLADEGQSTAITIAWDAQTVIGKLVIKVLAS
jgi:hypothetical protein